MSTTTRVEIIAEGQKAVDRANGCDEKPLAELSGGSITSTPVSGKDSVANRKDAEDKAAEDTGLGDASLVISRVDTRDGQDGKPDTWYVGRRAVSDVETRGSIVVLWPTPLAQKWSKALPGPRVRCSCGGNCAGRPYSTPSTSPSTAGSPPGAAENIRSSFTVPYTDPLFP
ncbi:hypothetical protein [Streptomyces sp. NBC_00009]|uniref:hypothetical protein n=1 Tax=Streptomyces sp. NBC_00009 TaxID=2975620 RepID=UPI00324FEEBB